MDLPSPSTNDGSIRWTDSDDGGGLDLGLDGFGMAAAGTTAPAPAAKPKAAATAASAFTFGDMDKSESDESIDPFGASPAPFGSAIDDPFRTSPVPAGSDPFATGNAATFAPVVVPAAAPSPPPAAAPSFKAAAAAASAFTFGDLDESEASTEDNPFAAARAPAPWGVTAADPFASPADPFGAPPTLGEDGTLSQTPAAIPEPEPTPVALYKCLLPAGVTANLEPGARPQVIMQYHEGDVLEIFDVQTTADGRRRVQTRDGWVSLVSGSGKELLVETTDAVGQLLAETGEDPFAEAIAITDPATGPAVPQAAVESQPSPAQPGPAETEEADFGDFLARLGSQLDELGGGGDGDGDGNAGDRSMAGLTVDIDLNDDSFGCAGGDVDSAAEPTGSSPFETVSPPQKAASPLEVKLPTSVGGTPGGSAQAKQSKRLSAPKANAIQQPKPGPKEKRRPKQQAERKSKPRRSSSPTIDVAGSSFLAETKSSRQRMSPRRELADQRASPEDTRSSLSPGGSWHFKAQQEAASHQASHHHHHRQGGAEAQAHPQVVHRSTAASRGRTGQSATVWDHPASAQSRHKARVKVDQRRSSGGGGGGGMSSIGGGNSSTAVSSIGTTPTGSGEEGPAAGSAPFTPQIAPKSNVLAAGRRERLQAEGHGFGHTSYGELLYRRGHEARAHKQTKAEREAAARSAAEEAAELAECTFTPSRITVTSRAARARAAKATNGRSEERPRRRSVGSRELLSPGAPDASMEARTAAFVNRRDEAMAAAKHAKAEAELQECTFTPSIKKHRNHSTRPKVEPGNGPNMARIEQIVKDREATLEARRQYDEDMAAQTRRLAVPEINPKSRDWNSRMSKKRAESVEDGDAGSLDVVEGDSDEEERDELPVHERLFKLSVARRERRRSVDQSQHLMQELRHKQDSGHYAGHSPRSPSPKADRGASESPEQRAQEHDVAKVALARMQKDIAKRRAKEARRQEQKEEELYSNANGRHTLRSSERLQRSKLVKALRRVFDETDEDDKGGLSSAELERALRQLRVLRMGLEHHEHQLSEGDGCRHKQEAHVLQLLGHLFEYGSEQGAGAAVLVDFNSFKQLLTRVFGKDEEPESPTGAGALELLPPEVGDQLVHELQALHAVNKHAFATGAGATFKQLRKEAVDAATRDNTFAPTINSRSRKLERLNNSMESADTFASPSNSARRADMSGASAAFTPSPAGGEKETRYERLYRSGQISARKKMEAHEEALVTESERAGCTFWPKTCKPPPGSQHRQPSFSDGPGIDTNDESSYYGDGSDGASMMSTSGAKVRLSRAEKLAHAKTTTALKEEEELSECFFYPVTNPPRQATVNNSPQQSADQSSVSKDKVRGFKEQVQRLRNGPNGIETKRQEEERLHRERVAREQEPTTQAVTKPVGPALLSREPVAAKRAKPILNMEVNAGAGRKGLIVLREGETPAAVAASFARVWALPPATESRLTRAIEMQLQRLRN